MTCRFSFLLRAAAPLLLSAAVARSASAQQPTPVPTPTIAPYRAPVIAQVQPAGGGTVPLDKPVVVFRFAAGEANDPVDVRSLVVAVDGADRSALFQTTASEAWGPLADAESIRRGAFASGPHRVTARICSSRGACATTDAQVIASATPGIAIDAPVPAGGQPGAAKRVLNAVVGVARKLIVP